MYNYLSKNKCFKRILKIFHGGTFNLNDLTLRFFIVQKYSLNILANFKYTPVLIMNVVFHPTSTFLQITDIIWQNETPFCN